MAPLPPKLCPECRSEYVHAATVCGDCDVPDPIGETGCSDPVCQDIVCFTGPNADSFCCDTAWDVVCAEAAIADATCCLSCPVPPGTCDAAEDCCQAHATPGCSDPVCEKLLCDVDPFCCDVEWDVACADAAQEEPACGCP